MIRMAMCILIVSTIAGCESTVESQREKPIRSRTDYGHGQLLTVVHDDHWFIVESRTSKGVLFHHPNCPCGHND